VLWQLMETEFHTAWTVVSFIMPGQWSVLYSMDSGHHECSFCGFDNYRCVLIAS